MKIYVPFFVFITLGILISGFNASASVTHYVSTNSFNPVAPYMTWDTAATNIQDAVDVSVDGDVVLVTNGVYFTGGRAAAGSTTTNIVCVDRAVSVQSVNGPYVTTINSGLSPLLSRCVYLTNNTALIGFTVTRGLYGGILCADVDSITISNCIISGNVPPGISRGTLYNCILTNNGNARFGFNELGGGASMSKLFDCLIVNNVATNGGRGGGIYGGTATRCLFAGNAASFGGAVSADQNFPVVLNDCVISNNMSGFAVVENPSFNAAPCVLNGCVLTANFGVNEVYSAILNNCVVSNHLGSGTAVRGGILSHCAVTGNPRGAVSGLVQPSVLNNCQVIGNSCTNLEAVASFCVLTNCVIAGNVAWSTVTTGGGGAASRATLYNCIIVSNSVLPAPGTFAASCRGGGVHSSTLYNCLVAYNFAATNGGGACNSTLVNCTVVANSAPDGSGVYGSILTNCIVYDNVGSENWSGGTNVYCCAVPLPAGAGNFTNAPGFMNLATGNFHLQSNSPCINAGINVATGITNDLDGYSRIVARTIDVGAYEYPSPDSALSYRWAQQFGLLTDGSMDNVDTDHDGMNNWQEWKCGTSPTDASSLLVLQNPVVGTNVVITWQSVLANLYYIQRSADMVNFEAIATNIVGRAGFTSYTNNIASGSGSYFYRVGVQ